MSNLLPNRLKLTPTIVQIITELGQDNQITSLDAMMIPSCGIRQMLILVAPSTVCPLQRDTKLWLSFMSVM